jgi:endonuclease V-like protein UPF0215 family
MAWWQGMTAAKQVNQMSVAQLTGDGHDATRQKQITKQHSKRVRLNPVLMHCIHSFEIAAAGFIPST